MESASSTRVVDVPLDRVWAVIADVRTVREYNPAVRSVDLLTDHATGLGATRRCNFHDGTDVLEEVVSSDPETYLKLVLSEYSLPMKHLEAEYSLAPTDDGRTEITFAINYEMKMGILGRALSALVVHKKLVETTGTMLAGLAHHLATGETVEPGFKAA